MPRCGGIRRYLREIAESPDAEKIAFIPPFIILIIETVLIIHAFMLNEVFVIVLTGFLFFVSVIEILMITREIHQHRCQTNFERELAIRLDDFIIDRHMDNVSNIVTDFLNEFEEYHGNRTMIYHIACQIMETHKRELWEKTLKTRLKLFLEKTDERALRNIIERFLTKYPEYRKDPEKVYQLTALYIDRWQRSR
jgi:hypothetical protein